MWTQRWIGFTPDLGRLSHCNLLSSIKWEFPLWMKIQQAQYVAARFCCEDRPELPNGAVTTGAV